MHQNKRQHELLQGKNIFGFTLIEVVVAMGVFSLTMAIVSVVFSQGFASNKNTMNSQKYLENAQYIMNDLVKQLRTSSVIAPTGNPATNTNPVSIKFFDHSRSQCVMYQQHTAPNYIEKKVGTATTSALCDTTPGFGAATRVTAGEVTMNLSIRNSSLASRAGLVSMSFLVGGGGSPVSPILLQSAVSLRDYGESLAW